MSHVSQIDYQFISIECQSICELANEQLCKLDKILENIESGSSQLLNSQTDALKEEILKSKRNIEDNIKSLINKVKKYADSNYRGEYGDDYNLINEARNLKEMSENLINFKVTEMEALLNELMFERINSQRGKSSSKKSNLSSDIQKKIDNMEDVIMKQYVYLAWLNNPECSFEELGNIAEEMKINAEEKHYNSIEKQEIREIKEELRKQKIEETTIEKIVNKQDTSAKERLQKIRSEANKEIIDEKIRYESVKIIVTAIRKRGFLINKDAIKIDRKNNQVNIVAQKPSGAKAEFKVYLDGKFVYKFDGYEGQACQDDIKPFMNDLKEIYGMKIEKETEIWSNPDKNSTMKYQTINYNKNRG